MTAIGSLPMNNDNISAIFVVDRINQVTSRVFRCSHQVLGPSHWLFIDVRLRFVLTN